MDNIQQEFEQWVAKEFDFSGEIPWTHNEVKLLWYGWKASRENVKVKLPECYHICGNGDNYDKDEMLKALDKAGVKY